MFKCACLAKIESACVESCLLNNWFNLENNTNSRDLFSK